MIPQKNKYNIQVVIGRTIYFDFIDQIEHYNNSYYYIIRRTKLENYEFLKYGIQLAYPLIQQKTINYVASKKR